MATKIAGMKKAIAEHNEEPDRILIWSTKRTDGSVEVWADEPLRADDRITRPGDAIRRVDDVMERIARRICESDGEDAMPAQSTLLRRAVEEVWAEVPDLTPVSDDGTLRSIASEVGRRYGFTCVDAEFTPFVAMKLTWARSYNWMDMQVSDYFVGAPAKVIRSAIERTFESIRGQKRSPFPDDVNEYIYSQIRRTKRVIHLGRLCACGYEPNRRARYHSIMDAVRRLEANGLIKGHEGYDLGWVTPDNGKVVSVVSQVFETALFSTRLDTDGIDSESFDYAVYRALAQLEMGPNFKAEPREEEIERVLDRYPDRQNAVSKLRKAGFAIS